MTTMTLTEIQAIKCDCGKHSIASGSWWRGMPEGTYDVSYDVLSELRFIGAITTRECHSYDVCVVPMRKRSRRSTQASRQQVG